VKIKWRPLFASQTRRGGLTIFSEEREQPYDRTLLTKDYLEGSFGDDRLPIARHSLADLGVDFEGGANVQQIEPGNKRLRLANGDERPYEKLLLATGATPRRLDVPGGDLPHVMVLRSLQDCRRILAKAISGTRVAVVGGSFIAMEAAASLIGRVLSVDVIAPEEHPLEKVFGRELSDLVLEAHSRNGVRLHLAAKVARIEDKQVALQGGERIDADLVVVGIGVEPRLELAEAAGLALDRGVLVNSRLQTSDPDIFAAGDIARWPDPHTGESIRVEHWVVAERQGQIAAANMLGDDQPFVMVHSSGRNTSTSRCAMSAMRRNGTKHLSRVISRTGTASSASAARAAISLSLPSNVTKTPSALSWRWKASPSGTREQAERLRTLDGTPVRHAGPLADQYGCRQPKGPARWESPVKSLSRRETLKTCVR
jgi:NADPH-dependent 2,4-dienoyl-CoA reductase/sulfur reductase-like enzyme